MFVMTIILTLSAAAIAIGIVYNNARIALSMRSRDLATLRVLGFTRREISNVLLGILALAAVGALLCNVLPKPVPVATAIARRQSLAVTVEEEGKTRVRDRFV